MESVTQVKILDKDVCSSLLTNTFHKEMNPSVLFPLAMSKLYGRLDSLAFVMQTV